VTRFGSDEFDILQNFVLLYQPGQENLALKIG